MSGGIKLSKNTFWGKAGWRYRAARDGICEALRETPDGHSLADELSAESHPAQYLEYLVISGWPDDKKKLFFAAIYRCADRFAKEGPVGWRDPSSFPSFLHAMNELVQLARQIEAESQN